MNFKDALLINEEIILEIKTEKYLDNFFDHIKNNYPVFFYQNKILKVEPKKYTSSNYLEIPVELSNKKSIYIKTGLETKELNIFINDVYNTAIQQNRFKEKDLESLKISLNKFKEKVINYK